MGFSSEQTGFPLILDNDWPDIESADHPGDTGVELWKALNYLESQVQALQYRLGVAGSSVVGSIEQRLSAITGEATTLAIDVTQYGVLQSDHPDFVDAATNAANFNAIEAFITGACVFWFPPGTYPTTGFQLTKRGHKILGAGGMSAIFSGNPSKAGTIFRMTGTGACLDLQGSNTVGGRRYGLQVEGVKLENAGTGTNIGLRMRHLTHFILRDIAITSFRGHGGGIQFYNSMDGRCYDISIDFCGSADGTNKAAMLFTEAAVAEGGTAEDACNEITFYGIRMENISDRYIEFHSGSGLITNRIRFIGGKFESSQNDTNGLRGSNDSSQAVFLYVNSSEIQYVCCDFAMQDVHSAVTWEIRRMHYLTGGSSVFMDSVIFAIGAGSFPKVFTTMIEATGSGSNLVALSNVMLNSGNSTAFPDTFLKGSNSPKLWQSNVGFGPFQGSGKVATDWYTAAEWNETAGKVA